MYSNADPIERMTLHYAIRNTRQLAFVTYQSKCLMEYANTFLIKQRITESDIVQSGIVTALPVARYCVNRSAVGWLIAKDCEKCKER